MNPARSLGRATVAGDWALLRVYFIGPPLGAVAAAVAFRFFLPQRRTLTAKLFHDERYVSTLRAEPPAQAPPQKRGVAVSATTSDST